MAVTITCKCGKKFTTKPSRLKEGRGIYCSKTCLYKYRIQPKRSKYNLKVINKSWFKINDTKGPKNINWKGGVTPLIEQIRRCFRYRLWHSDIFTRDYWTCQECNKKGGNLHVHHIKQLVIIITENNINTIKEALECSELWDINNGITLCKKCHEEQGMKQCKKLV